MCGEFAGLKVLKEDGRVFACHDSMWATIRFSEIGSSKAILDAGYNLDSFMVRPRHITTCQVFSKTTPAS